MGHKKYGVYVTESLFEHLFAFFNLCYASSKVSGKVISSFPALFNNAVLMLRRNLELSHRFPIHTYSVYFI